MIDRLNEYKHKCKVLRQINSDKALLYKRINSILDFMTIFVSLLSLVFQEMKKS